MEKGTYEGLTGSREYFVHTPDSVQPNSRVPPVVMLHGCLQGPEDFAALTGMNRVADDNKFIVVYPRQERTDHPTRCWNWFEPSNQSRDRGEAAILAGITQTVQQNTARWRIDPKQVYVAGLSAGAAMTVILGATYPDIFAAIGVHSGLEYKAATGEQEARRAMAIGGPDPIEQGLLAYQAICNAMHDKARIVPTIVFHGTNDQIVHPVNGHRVVRQWMETNWRVSGGTYIPVFRSRIRRRGRVQDGPNGRSYTVEEWKDTGDKVVQEYWTVDGMGHEWSGGREGMPFSDPKGPNASQEMYRFFLDHPAP